ncbi:DUF2268 domain-containing putative Zn-dependent protease [Jannaschia sp. W003]|uniref:DUF2268 domain-containing putative Zn-dependent protease n=1 Tax=Jannaschia sp. W003 TaxID=2867012 RepID=UPI0021A73DC6|nr:DUF2268 domain-containing putative Zn-dependent protease [Jannaschia sp. W003]UWQ20930.1 DUF2268 domain-containing putative Zn-dependent protease [Jannaschia sp. W003]
MDHVGAVSDLSDVDLIVHPTDFGRDQFPIAAFTMGPNNIHIGIERSQLSSEELESELLRTTVHELHHALRWRYVSRWTVGEAVILEGLALVADHAVGGPQEGVDRPLSDIAEAMEYVTSHRDEKLENHRNWLYTSEPSQPGGIARVYTVGLLMMRNAILELGGDSWNAAKLPAPRLLDAGEAAVRRRVLAQAG